MNHLNWKVVAHTLGLLLGLNGLFMLLGIPFALYYQEGGLIPLLQAGGGSLIIGALAWFLTRNSNKTIRKREGYLIVTLGWVVMSISGALPYVLSNVIPDFTSAFFETMSGYTTTGASVLSDIESVPKSILFWRSMTHWIGGMGVIVLMIAILPILGIGGMQLFVAESPGITADKLHPRIKETAKRLWIIYVALTFAETILLMFGKMNFFDSLCHSMATVSTGGFSTKNASIAHYDSPYIQYVIILFMFVSGMNFSLTYFGLKGKLHKVWKNEEFRVYLFATLGLTLLATFLVWHHAGLGVEKSFRDAMFQVVAVMTTTGFVTADYTDWGTGVNFPFSTMLFFAIMFIGGSAGSTAGGVKIVRHSIIFKNSLLELKRLIHPAAIVPVRYNRSVVTEGIAFNVLSFFLLYMVVFSMGTLLMSAFGSDMSTSLGATASCLGNVGPGLGDVGPVFNYGGIHLPGKWVLSFLMLLGRLELFTVIILFSPAFWRRH